MNCTGEKVDGHKQLDLEPSMVYSGNRVRVAGYPWALGFRLGLIPALELAGTLGREFQPGCRSK